MLKRFALWMLFAGVLFFVSGCAKQNSLSSQETPFYQDMQLSERQQKENADFLVKAVSQASGKEKAASNLIKEASAYLESGQDQLAMKRLNYAWSLDPSRGEIYAGFGFLLARQGQGEPAIRMYERSIELYQEPITLCRLARLYQTKAVWNLQKFPKNAPLPPDVKAGSQADFIRAFELYDRASRLAVSDSQRSYLYYEWAVALATIRDYAHAWEKIHLSQKYGGEFIQKKFIEKLSKDLPEPSA